MNEIERLKYEDELKSNRFSSMFLVGMCAICLMLWVANELGIFVVNRMFMRMGIIIGCICLMIPVALYVVTGGKNGWFKYALIVCVSLMTISIQTFLTFHGVLVCIFPIMLAAQYSKRRVFHVAFWINLFGILFSVVAGYYIGCWDGNMIYATTYGITLAKDSAAGRAAAMNAHYMVELLLYFAFPRMVIYSAIALSTSYIWKNSKIQYARQSMIRAKAEHDALTGLENRAKFNERANREYPHMNTIYIAFIDVNFLKKINDTCGHESGDSVLKRVASEMQYLTGEHIHGYRLGGDEFAFVFCDYRLEDARNVMECWERNIGPLNRKEDAVKCSLAIGDAYGTKPVDVESILKEADKNMYERKKSMKALREE